MHEANWSSFIIIISYYYFNVTENQQQEFSNTIIRCCCSTCEKKSEIILLTRQQRQLLQLAILRDVEPGAALAFVLLNNRATRLILYFVDERGRRRYTAARWSTAYFVCLKFNNKKFVNFSKKKKQWLIKILLHVDFFALE